MTTNKANILIAISGITVNNIIYEVINELQLEYNIKVILSKEVQKDTITKKLNISIYTDESETWNRVGDSVLHIELTKWADLIIIAPLSANTLAKMGNGLYDDLLTCVIRAWDYNKPFIVAPAMNTSMYSNPFTEKHLKVLSELGIIIIPSTSKKLASGEVKFGGMADSTSIINTINSILINNKIS